MGIRPLIQRARTALRRMSADDAESSSVENSSINRSTVEQSKRDPAVNDATIGNGHNDPGAEEHSEVLQAGVRDVEAVTQTWSRATLITVFLKYVFFILIHVLLSWMPIDQYIS